MIAFAAAWADLQARIRALDDDSPPIELVRSLILWFREYPSLITSKPFSSYHFEKYLALDEEDYPIDLHPLTFDELKRIKVKINEYTAQKLDLIPQYLRDILDSYLVLEINEDCPVCGTPGLRVYASRVDRRLAYECRQCGFAKYQDGSSVEAMRLTMAKRSELREANLIRSA